jgi:hypothetical protein
MGGTMTRMIQTQDRIRGFRLRLRGGEGTITGDLGDRGVIAETAIEGFEGGVEA